MGIMPKRNLPPGTKVKRLSLYPRQKYSFEKAEEAGEAPKAKPPRRWIPTREKPEMKAPARLPYYRDLPPRYEQPAPPPPPPPAAPAPVDNTASIFITGFIIVFVIFFVILISNNGGGGGGNSACPQQSRIRGCGTIAPQCKCPADCPHYFIITNPPQYKGYKQCTP